jgi:hypothetical protein
MSRMVRMLVDDFEWMCHLESKVDALEFELADAYEEIRQLRNKLIDCGCKDG